MPYSSDKRLLTPFGSMIYKGQCNDTLMSFLKDVAEKTKERGEDHGHKLAGNIEDQRTCVIRNNRFKTLIYPHIYAYHIACMERTARYALGDNYWGPSKDVPDGMIDFRIHGGPWINFMKKGEFNPIHSHTGEISSVVCIDIPIEISQEETPYESNMPCAGQLEFIDYEPGTHKEITKTGDIFLFPADLKHCVYPFASDVERVTMSFNVDGVRYV